MTCSYCHGVRLVGWSGAGPILCPECSRGQDAFTVITQAWREQRAEVKGLQAFRSSVTSLVVDHTDPNDAPGDDEALARIARIRIVADMNAALVAKLRALAARWDWKGRWAAAVELREVLPKETDRG